MEDKPAKIFLVRHGEVANANERCYNGHYDVALSPEGLRQMLSVADRLRDKPIKAVYSSDLQRASKGAKIIAERHSIEPIPIKDLRELNYGIWEGRRLDEIRRLYPDDVLNRYNNIENYRIPGGETLLEMRERVLSSVNNIIESHRGNDVVIVSHGGVNRIVLLWSLNMVLKDFYKLQQNYAALNIVNFYDNGSSIVELMNG
jgi:alpha-ribazole phosphatase